MQRINPKKNLIPKKYYKFMPKKEEAKLKRQAKKKGLKGKRANAYVYGTLREMGWVPSTQKKSKKK